MAYEEYRPNNQREGVNMTITATDIGVEQHVKDEIDSISVGNEVQGDPQAWTKEGRVD